jgi:chromosomal replication initiator protein
MDLVQIWHDAIQSCKQSINDPQKQAIYGLIEFQSSIQIIGSDLCFICNNDFMMKLMSEFSPSLYMEISRLLGNNNLGLKLLLARGLHKRQTNNQLQPANVAFQN